MSSDERHVHLILSDLCRNSFETLQNIPISKTGRNKKTNLFISCKIYLTKYYIHCLYVSGTFSQTILRFYASVHFVTVHKIYNSCTDSFFGIVLLGWCIFLNVLPPIATVLYFTLTWHGQNTETNTFSCIVYDRLAMLRKFFDSSIPEEIRRIMVEEVGKLSLESTFVIKADFCIKTGKGGILRDLNEIVQRAEKVKIWWIKTKLLYGERRRWKSVS